MPQHSMPKFMYLILNLLLACKPVEITQDSRICITYRAKDYIYFKMVGQAFKQFATSK